jgi:hypothetical protein
VVSEPVQLHIEALVEFDDNVTVPPLHIGPLLVAPVEVGTTVLTVTTVVYTVDGLQPDPVLLKVSE